MRIFPIAVLLLFVPFSFATKEMATKENKQCITCHKSAQGGSQGNPELKPGGIRYLQQIVEKADYVPLNSFKELNLLAEKIAQNKKKKEGGVAATEAPKAAEAPKAEEAPKPAEASKPAENKPVETAKPAEPVAAETNPSASKEEPKKADPSPVEEKEKKPAAEKTPIAKLIPNPTSEKILLPKKTESSAKSGPAILPKKSRVGLSSDKIVILKRNQQATQPTSATYDWSRDWEYDDYF